MYKFQAIILNITKIRDNNTRIVMLSAEYGKITGWWNKKNITGIDLGDIIEVLISRDENKNIIKNIDVSKPGWNKSWDYHQIHAFLETLNIITKISIDKIDSHYLFMDVAYLIQY